MNQFKNDVKPFERAIFETRKNNQINDTHRLFIGLGVASVMGIAGMFFVAFFMRVLTAPTIVQPPPPQPIKVDCPWIGSCEVQ